MKYNGLNGVWDDFKKKFVKKGTLDWNWTKLLDGPLLGDELETQEDKLQRFIDAPDTFII